MEQHNLYVILWPVIMSLMCVTFPMGTVEETDTTRKGKCRSNFARGDARLLPCGLRCTTKPCVNALCMVDDREFLVELREFSW